MSEDKTPEWFENWFGTEYLALYSHRSLTEATKQIAFLNETFAKIGKPFNDSANLLDIACGAGRHLEALRELGVTACGIDLSETLINEALKKNLNATLADMRNVPFTDETFSHLISMFTSFGYFDTDREHISLLSEWRRVIKPQGSIFIDYLNKSFVIDNLVPTTIEERDGKIITQKRYIKNSRINKDITITNKETNESQHFKESVQMYNYPEMQSLLQAANLTIKDTFGDFNGSAYNENSNRLLIFANRA